MLVKSEPRHGKWRYVPAAGHQSRCQGRPVSEHESGVEYVLVGSFMSVDPDDNRLTRISPFRLETSSHSSV